MKVLSLLLLVLLFFGCSPKKVPVMEKVSFSDLPSHFEEEDFQSVLTLFKKNCVSGKTRSLYAELCEEALYVDDSKEFMLKNFQPYQINNVKDGGDEGLLTGYYLASLHASLTETEKYRYPIYETPSDLVSVDLSSIYPELKSYRLRGRLVGDTLIPYYSREEATKIKADVLCYCDSKIDKFFLEIQGSGKVFLDNNSTMFIGYDNQNGHKYRAIGRYLIEEGEIPKEEISMQSIRTWLDQHPMRVDEVLNYNHSLVFFKERDKGAVGALGLELSPIRSVAVDPKYIKLGTMLYLDADLEDAKISNIVFAQDTGGAIKGSVRADLFTGFGAQAEALAGRLKAPLKLWAFLPKEDNFKKE